ncbi:MAG: T9SS type A sorting domain-containing protein [Prolixibacteraceae bacterium]|nr:T9SS type A sorting domain-containing protein [Prolixibacteraceae bacterium]
MLLASAAFAQKEPITFEAGGQGGTWTWNVFENDTNPALEIIDNPDKSGINTSLKVAKFTALKTGQPWAGCESLQGVDLGTFQWNDTNRTVKIMVWKSVISDVGIKFDTETGWSQGERKVANTKINQWEELTFDFSSFINPPEGNGTLGRIVIFPDFDTDGRDQNNIVYFDNISFHPAEATSDVPTAAAPAPPARAAGDVLSVFSGAYTNVTGTDFNPGWGQSTLVSTVDISENPTLKYASFNYQGTQFATPLNVTEMDFLHLDMWTADATAVNIFCISTGPVEKAYALPITPGQWTGYDIPMTTFAGVNLADVIQFKFDGGDGTPVLFLDNLYFYKVATSIPTLDANTLRVYPNPVQQGLPVRLGGEARQIDLLDLTGKAISSKNNASMLDTRGLRPGVYLLRIHHHGGQVQTTKLLVK